MYSTCTLAPHAQRTAIHADSCMSSSARASGAPLCVAACTDCLLQAFARRLAIKGSCAAMRSAAMRNVDLEWGP